MKVFWLSKAKDEIILPLFRGEALRVSPSKVKIAPSGEFRFISISNPSSSSCICTVLNLHFSSKDTNLLRLYMGEINDFDDSLNTDGVLSITHMSSQPLFNNFTELSELKFTGGENFELSADNYTILLPGGSLLISLEKPVNYAEIIVNYSMEFF